MKSLILIFSILFSLNSFGAFKTFKGTLENDKLQGTDYNDRIYAFRGDDILYGYDGVNLLYGGQGNDYYYHTPKISAYDYIHDENTCDVNVLICNFPSDENVKCRSQRVATYDLQMTCIGEKNLKSHIRIYGYYNFEKCNSRRTGWRISCN